MDKGENLHCRFCAEPKSSNKLLDLENDESKYNETLLKLNFVNAFYVDLSLPDLLPKTVCFICYNSLGKAYEFLNNVKNAQEILSNLYPKDNKSSLSDDDTYEDYLPDNENSEIKSEKTKSDSVEFNLSVDIKPELKKEFEDSNLEHDFNNENFDQSLNVQDILDAAICNGPFGSKVTIYAKEITDISKKNVTSWKDYPWVCSYCNIEFLDVETLRSHSKVVHGKCSAFFCIDCKNGKNEDFNYFVNHVRKHRKVLRNHCHYCDLFLEETVNLKSHLKQHFQKAQIPCIFCGEILKNEDALQKHLIEFNMTKPKRKPRRKRGAPITQEELTCKLCQKVYKNPNSLRDHMKLHNTDRKRDYTCDRCGKTFFNKGTLTSHIMSHDKIRPHICRICNKSFIFPNMLRRHVEMHSGVKPFSCEQCGRCFRLQYQLNAHKIIHTDAMPYTCQYCNKVFRFKQILKNHERQHTGVKPYNCDHCGMEFTNWSNYNKHMKRRHATDTSKKKITPEGVFPINPETGQIITVQDPVETEEWKSKIMIPAKRGKKKVIKKESEHS